MDLIELALKLWNTQYESKMAYSIEYPALTDMKTYKGIKDYKPHLQQQWQLILEESRKIKSKVHNFQSDECRQQFKESCAHMEGALCALNEMLTQVDAKAVPYTVADAVLLHASTLLEQAALALIAQLGITNPQATDQRPWKYTHDISDFLAKIGENDETFKLTDHQLKHVQEITEFLTTTTHYPSAGKGSLSQDFDNLRKMCELKRKLVSKQGFLAGEEGTWCRGKFETNPQKTWPQQLDDHIEIDLNDKIYSRVLEILEIALIIVRKI